MIQLSLSARVRREDGIRRADDHADEDWKEAAFRALSSYLRTHPTLFCDDLWEHIERPRESRALGPVILRAARERLMVRSGEYRKSVASNLSEKPVWRSLVYVGSPKGENT
jgi:hypothetical protein